MLEGVNELVALLLPGGPAFVDALSRAWERSDAVLPLDPTAPPAVTARLIDELAPGAIVEADGERRRLERGRPVEPGDAVVIATSGTTGAPKGAVHTVESVEYAAFATSVATGVAADTRWLACLPLSHVGGFSVITRALVTGAQLEVHPGFDPASVDLAASTGATHVSLVPAVLGRIDVAAWRTILLGGSAIPADRPPNSIATYGMTESFGGVVYDGLPLDGVQVRIIDLEREHDPRRPHLAPAGAPGAIELRSPTLLRAYRDGTVPLEPDGWYRTGDLGRLDPSTGHLEVHGRADDLIITGGEKVWPAPVERVLSGDRRVREVAVLGRADPEWGQRVVAVVVPEDPADPPTLQALRDLVRATMPRAHAPKELQLVDSLPRTGLGKIRRSSIGELGSERGDV